MFEGDSGGVWSNLLLKAGITSRLNQIAWGFVQSIFEYLH